MRKGNSPPVKKLCKLGKKEMMKAGTGKEMGVGVDEDEEVGLYLAAGNGTGVGGKCMVLSMQTCLRY